MSPLQGKIASGSSACAAVEVSGTVAGHPQHGVTALVCHVLKQDESEALPVLQLRPRATHAKQNACHTELVERDEAMFWPSPLG
eukprot:5687320-Amphidinium_carterae.2